MAIPLLILFWLIMIVQSEHDEPAPGVDEPWEVTDEAF
jgi:hypothetical protein